MHPVTKRNLLLHLQFVQKDINAAITALKDDIPIAAMFFTNLAVADANRAHDAFVKLRNSKIIS